jgi:predicted transcriptional regulator
MDDIELITDHEDKSQRARAYLSQEYQDLINALKAEIEDEPTAGMLAVLVSALKAYGELYQVRTAPGASGKLTEVQVSRLIQAAVAEERARVLEEVKASQRAALSQASGDVRENLKALSDKSLS